MAEPPDWKENAELDKGHSKMDAKIKFGRYLVVKFPSIPSSSFKINLKISVDLELSNFFETVNQI